MFIVDVISLRFRYYLSVVTGLKFTLRLYVTKLIGMSRCVGLECFCSSTGRNVYEFSSASIYWKVWKETLLDLSAKYLLGVTGFILASHVRLVSDIYRAHAYLCRCDSTVFCFRKLKSRRLIFLINFRSNLTINNVSRAKKMRSE